MRVSGDEIGGGDLWAMFFDISRAYERGFRGAMRLGTRIYRLSEHADFVEAFGRGRLYQATDEATRTGEVGLLEGLVVEL
jgi:hypothetical protein